jgi:hypothetical protein
VIDLAAIRERDRAAEKCDRCGSTINGHRDDTLAQCNARLRSAAKRQHLPPRECRDPDAHHPFEPSGRYDDWNGDLDRHLLLDLVDALSGGNA